MNIGPLLFAFALVPFAVLFRALQALRRSLKNHNTRRLAIIEMPIVLALSPLLITIFMMGEARIDPEFLSRSFVNPQAVTWKTLGVFAIDQTLGGALFDVTEVFRLSFSPLEHKCDSVLFCISIALYRTSVSIAASTLILATMLSIFGHGGSSKK